MFSRSKPLGLLALLLAAALLSGCAGETYVSPTPVPTAQASCDDPALYQDAQGNRVLIAPPGPDPLPGQQRDRIGIKL